MPALHTNSPTPLPPPSSKTEQAYPSPPFMESTSNSHHPINHRPPPTESQSALPPSDPHPPDPDLLSLRQTLQNELPDLTTPGLVPLSEVVDAAVRDIYKRMMELGEVLPSLHEGARAAEVFQFALFARRQVVKLLALVRWSQQTDVVTKCLNLIGFLNRQNGQFDQSINQISAVKSGLGTTRLRNPDILTAVDVLSTGTYQRLPARYQVEFEPEPPLSKPVIRKVLGQLNELIAFRLKALEIIPTQMKDYRIADGRAYFTYPGFFRASICLLGAQEPLETDSEEQRAIKLELGKKGGEWYLLDLEFSFGIGGRESTEDVRRLFPTKPDKPTFEEIRRATQLQLQPCPDSLPLPIPPVSHEPGGAVETHGLNSPAPTGSVFRSKLGGEEDRERVVDAPLVRMFNLFNCLSLTYQLEILHHQAQRIQNLGWVDCFNLQMAKDRRSFTISYWPRQRRIAALSSSTGSTMTTSIAGTLVLSLSSSPPSSSTSTVNRIMNAIETEVKAAVPSEEDREKEGRVSDRVVEQGLGVRWEMEKKWSGGIDLGAGVESRLDRLIDPTCLDLERTLLDSLKTHANHLIRAFHQKVVDHPMNSVIFDVPGGDIVLAEREPGSLVLQVRIHGNQFIHVFVDPRSGKINLRDNNDIISATGDSTLQQLTARLNDNPTPSALNDVLLRLKFSTIRDTLTQKLQYLGFSVLRSLPLKQGELAKFGATVHFLIYVPLPCAPNHYFVTIMTPSDFRFALVSIRPVVENGLRWALVDQIGFLDREGIGRRMSERMTAETDLLGKRKRSVRPLWKAKSTRFHVEVDDLRGLYRYCIARVTSHRIESQLKARHVPYELAPRPSHASILSSRTKGKGRADSTAEGAVPVIVVQAPDLLRNIPTPTGVAMPNVSIRVLNWWNDEQFQVITSFKLRHRLNLSQPTIPKTSSSRTIFVDPATSVVNIVTKDVDRCVDTFIEEFSRVGKLAAVANEIALLKDPKLRMTHFDLHTTCFIYAPGLMVSIGWKLGSLPGLSQGRYLLTFGTVQSSEPDPAEPDRSDGTNPHAIMTDFFQQRLNDSGRFTGCLFLLRATLPFLKASRTILSNPSPSPDLSIKLWPRSITSFSFLYEKANIRYGFTYTVLPNRQDVRYLIQDSSLGDFVPPSNGVPNRPRFTPIPNVLESMTAARTEAFEAYPKGLGRQNGQKAAPVVVLGPQEGMVCAVECVKEVVEVLHRRTIDLF